MPTEQVEHGPYKLTVTEADIAIGAKRFRLRENMKPPAEGVDPEGTDPDRKYLREFVYPNLVAPVIAHEGFEHWPPTFEEFLALPERLWDKWSASVRRLNGHWFGDDEETADPKG